MDLSLQFRSEVQQQLVFSPSLLSEDSLKFAEHILSKPQVLFAPTSIRGSTLISSQGDHATAYALYWEMMRLATAKHAREDELHVSPFITEISSRLQQDLDSLKYCKLYVESESLLSDIGRVKEKIKQAILPLICPEPDYKGTPEIRINQMIGFCQNMLTHSSLKQQLALHDQLNIELRELILKKDLREHLKLWKDKFEDLNERISNLQEKYNQEIRELKETYRVQKTIIDSAESLLDKLKEQGPKTLIDGETLTLLEQIQQLRDLQTKTDIRSKITQLKADYFNSIIRELAEKFLLYQNQMPYVTFQKIPGMEASSGEGANVSRALAELRKYDEPSKLVTTLECASIAQHIITLLFFPKIEEVLLRELEGQKIEVLKNNRKSVIQCVFIRNNDLNVFSYVIARHLQIIFNAFPRFLAPPDIKKEIMDQFVSGMFTDWRLSREEKRACKEKIDQIMEIYKDSADPEEDLSLTDGSLSASDSPPPKGPLTFTATSSGLSSRSLSSELLAVSSTSAPAFAPHPPGSTASPASIVTQRPAPPVAPPLIPTSLLTVPYSAPALPLVRFLNNERKPLSSEFSSRPDMDAAGNETLRAPAPTPVDDAGIPSTQLPQLSPSKVSRLDNIAGVFRSLSISDTDNALNTPNDIMFSSPQRRYPMQSSTMTLGAALNPPQPGDKGGHNLRSRKPAVIPPPPTTRR